MTASMQQKIRRSRMGGRVERCHGVPHHGSYSNASHQWGVAMLMWYLWPEHFHRLVIYCLSHDVPEAWVGDIPSPTLRFVPGIREKLEPLEKKINEELDLPAECDLVPEDYERLKACDRLELYIWAQEQLELGNKNAESLLAELDRYFVIKELPDRAKALYEELKNEPPARVSGVIRSLVGESAA